GKRRRFTEAGMPTTIANGGTSLVTSEPAPTIAPSPTETPPMMFTLWPVQTSLPIVTVSNMSGVRDNRVKALYSSTQSNELGWYWNSWMLSQSTGWLNGLIAVRAPIEQKWPTVARAM